MYLNVLLTRHEDEDVSVVSGQVDLQKNQNERFERREHLRI